MYFRTSSSVMPMPVSEIRMIFFSLSTVTVAAICSSLSGCSIRNLVIASQALLTASRRKISLSEYSHRLITGIIFCASIDTEPFSFWIAIVLKLPFVYTHIRRNILDCTGIVAPPISICKQKLALSPREC